MKLGSIEIENFRAIGRCNLPIEDDVTIIVGDNAAGKTAIIEAIKMAMYPIDRFYYEGDEEIDINEIDFLNVRLLTEYDNVVPLQSEVWPLSVSASVLIGGNKHEFSVIHRLHSKNHLLSDFQCDDDEFYHALSGDVKTIFLYYGIDRVLSGKMSGDHGRDDFSIGTRISFKSDGQFAREGALEGKAVFADAVKWFEALENLELRNRRDTKNPEWRNPLLSAVRNAVEQMMDNVSNLRVTGLPPRLTVDFLGPNGRKEPLLIDQLSGGYRSLLAMVIDLSRRLAMLNPEMENPLLAPGIVLIDEIDLHLHPKWQQTVLWKLKSIFKDIQFIVTTHSELVLSGFHRRNIRKIVWDGDELTFDRDLTSTYGAESGRLQEEVMGVGQRPPESMSEFTRLLGEYREMLYANRWQTAEADEVWQRLHMLNPDDPVLRTLELERRRRSVKR